MDRGSSILAFRVGRRKADASMFLYFTDVGKEVEVYYYFWCVVLNNRVIVVDTGFPSEEGKKRGLDECWEPKDLLRAIRLDPKQVELIILTHLHWDHSSCTELFTNAKVVVQKEEIEFATGPLGKHPCLQRYLPTLEFLNKLEDEERLIVIDGDKEVIQGLKMFKIGGHTPGSQSIVIDDIAVICGDVCPLYRNFQEGVPCGILTNLPEALQGLDKLRELANTSLILPSHDPSVYENNKKVAEGVVKVL